MLPCCSAQNCSIGMIITFHVVTVAIVIVLMVLPFWLYIISIDSKLVIVPLALSDDGDGHAGFAGCWG